MLERQGARLVKAAAEATTGDRGRRHDDGRRCSRRRSSAHGIRNVAAGADPIALRRGIERAVEQVVAHLRDVQSREVAGREQIDPRRDDLGRRRRARRRDRRGLRRGRQGRRRHRPGQRPPRARAGADRGHAASAAATSRRTWSPTPSAWRPCSRTPTSSISGERPSTADEVLPLLDQLIPTGKPLLLLAEESRATRSRRSSSTSCAGSSRRSRCRRRSTGAQRRSMHEDLAILTGGLPVDARARPHAGQRSSSRSSAGPSASSSTARRRRSSAAAATRRRSSSGSGSSAASSRTTATSTSTSATSSASAWPGSAGRVAVIRVGAATETELAERMHRVAGRRAGDARRAARGDPPRRRRRAAERAGGDRHGGPRRPTRRPAPRSSAARSRSRCARSPSNAGYDAVGRGRRRRATLKPGRGLRRGDRRVRRPVRGGRDRPDAGHPLGARARRVDRARLVLVDRVRWSRARPREDDLAARGDRQLNDHAHQVVRRPPRELMYGAEARATLMAGHRRGRRHGQGDARARAAATSLLAQRDGGGPTITNDGVTIAERDRARRHVREPGRALRAPCRLGDERDRRRRHDDGHGARAGDRPRGDQERRRRRRPDGASGAGSSGPSSRSSRHLRDEQSREVTTPRAARPRRVDLGRRRGDRRA